MLITSRFTNKIDQMTLLVLLVFGRANVFKVVSSVFVLLLEIFKF